MSEGLLVHGVEALERVVDTAPDAATAVRDALARISDGSGALAAPLAERLVAALAQHVFGAGVYDVLLREERVALVVAPLQRTAATAATALLSGVLAVLARPALRADALVPGLVACVRCAFLTAAPGTPAADPGIVQCFQNILETSKKEEEEDEWHTVLALLCTFFQRASNAVPTLDDCTPAAFVPHMLGPLCTHAVTRSSSPSSSPLRAGRMLAEAFTKACNLGQRDTAVVPLLLRHATAAPVMADAVAAAPQHVRGDVLAALARADTTAAMGALVACARACLAADRAGTEAVLASRLCTVRPVHAPAQAARYAAALGALGLARAAATTTARAWAELAYTTCVAPETHAAVTRLLCCLVRRADRGALHAWGLVAPLLEGVSAHLAASAARVRRLGMAVATVFSRVVDPAHALCFDGIDDAFIFGDSSEGGPAQRTDHEENTRTHKKKHKKTVDLDEEIDLNDDDDGDDDDKEDEGEESEGHEQEEGDDNDDGLEAYDLEDDYSDMELDDEHPSFIGQCLDALFDAKDDAAKVREALVTLAGLTDRPAHETGLADHAARVLDSLLFYHNSAGVDDFDLLKHHILLRTTVCCPALCARALCRAFYEENHVLADRTEILFLLREAAATLATLDHARTAEAHAALTAAAATSLQPRAPRIELLPLNSTAELPTHALGLTETNTRRWHTIRSTSDPAHQPVRNCFLEHADAFFYPLLSNVDKPLFAAPSLGHTHTSARASLKTSQHPFFPTEKQCA